MLHLALVQNLLTAVGAGPHLSRPNFPVPPRAFPARIQIALLPFGEEALRHFAFLERPGWDRHDRRRGICRARAGVALAGRSTRTRSARSLPTSRRSATSTARSRTAWTCSRTRMGEERLFIGPRDAQANGEHFRFAELVEVTDLASASAAIETIVEQGEGARGDWREAHFGRLLTILDEFLACARRTRPSSRRGRSCCRRRPAAGERRARCRSSPPVQRPLHGPAQRGLRGRAPAAGALLRPHRRDRRAAGRSWPRWRSG